MGLLGSRTPYCGSPLLGKGWIHTSLKRTCVGFSCDTFLWYLKTKDFLLKNLKLFPGLKLKAALTSSRMYRIYIIFPFFFWLWRGHLLRLRCSMTERVSGQAWSSVTMANSSSYRPMEGSFAWLMPLKELFCIRLGWADSVVPPQNLMLLWQQVPLGCEIAADTLSTMCSPVCATGL